jgi:hypothetical protein
MDVLSLRENKENKTEKMKGKNKRDKIMKAKMSKKDRKVSASIPQYIYVLIVLKLLILFTVLYLIFVKPILLIFRGKKK